MRALLGLDSACEYLRSVAFEVFHCVGAAVERHEYCFAGAADFRSSARPPIDVGGYEAQAFRAATGERHRPSLPASGDAEVEYDRQTLRRYLANNAERSPHVLLVDDELGELGEDVEA